MQTIIAILISLLFFVSALAAQDTRSLEREKAAAGQSDKRLALVIGNGSYQNARQLANSVNDATDIANTLTNLGFEVIYGVDLSLKQMNDKVREFGDKLKASGGVGLFYYAGHGIQVGGRNYLIPVEANIQREDEIDGAALNFDLVLRKMATANNGLNIIVLDACRNNPFARSWSRGEDQGGLAQVTAPTGTFIAYATSPDRTASDGTGRNGLYTSELLKVITDPTLKIEEAFKHVTIAVDRASDGNQVPWTSSSLRGEFYFKADEKNSKIVKQANVVPANDPPFAPPVSPETADWNKVKDSKDPTVIYAFLQKYPSGQYSQLAMMRMSEATRGVIGANPQNPGPSRPPAFLIDGEKRLQMKIALTKQDYDPKKGMKGLGGGGTKAVTEFNGGRSLLRVTNSQPELEFSLNNESVNVSDIITVLKLKTKADTREIQGMQKTFSGFRKEDIVPITFEEIPKTDGTPGKLYKIKFAGTLAPGEYAVFCKEASPAGQGIFAGIQIPTAQGQGTYYDFGVDPK